MSTALRQRATAIARQARPNSVRNTRSYASDSHGHGHGHGVDEPLGNGFFYAMATIPASIFLYSISRPAENGEQSRFTKWMEKMITEKRDEEERINAHNTALVNQAAIDRHILTYAPSNNGHHELRYPEVFQQGSPFNVPAGHGVNLDKVIAHYRKQHLDEEERKAKLAASK
ncbi:hypothetical protein QBC37DRAFT_178506 [Rhypophila decipiens]|uniref:Uncharacterized protein n=1 Tax=Rhypophila decipiens TaxID=261697 RepID=A0AAN6YM72_9PEZI|nr:hypothetical protein QBC37DRAFT_178506 [Rhypophila decipiens]